MIRKLGKTALMALAIAGGSALASHPATAQGPYGRNTYADFPYNQGSLGYRALRPGEIPGRPYRAPRRATNPYYAPAPPMAGSRSYQAPPGWYQTAQGMVYYPQGYTYQR